MFDRSAAFLDTTAGMSGLEVCEDVFCFLSHAKNHTAYPFYFVYCIYNLEFGHNANFEKQFMTQGCRSFVFTLKFKVFHFTPFLLLLTIVRAVVLAIVYFRGCVRVRRRCQLREIIHLLMSVGRVFVCVAWAVVALG